MKDTKAMGNTGAFQQMEKCEPFPAQSVWGPVGPQWGDKGYLVTCPGGHHEQGSWRGPQMALCNQTPVCPLQYIAIMASGACFALEGLVLQRRVQESWACLVLMYGNVYDLSKLAYLLNANMTCSNYMTCPNLPICFLPYWTPFHIMVVLLKLNVKIRQSTKILDSRTLIGTAPWTWIGVEIFPLSTFFAWYSSSSSLTSRVRHVRSENL